MSVKTVIKLFQTISAWTRRTASFQGNQTEQFMELEEFRGQIKNIIVWLEMHGSDDAAGQLEERMATLRERAWEFEHSCRHAAKYPPEEPWYDEKLHQMIDAAESVAGALEDLTVEIPEEVWRGIDDV